MRIVEIEYQQVKNLGNMETCRASAKMLLEDGESADKAFELAKLCVRRQLGMQEKQRAEEKEKAEIQARLKKHKITDSPVWGQYPATANVGGMTFRELMALDQERRMPTEINRLDRAATWDEPVNGGGGRARFDVGAIVTNENATGVGDITVRAQATGGAEAAETGNPQPL